MKQPAQPDTGHAQKAAMGPARSRPQRRDITPGGHLAQLSAMVNGGVRVPALAQMKDELQYSPRAQYLTNLAAQINQHTPAQLPDPPMNGDAGLEQGPAQLQEAGRDANAPIQRSAVIQRIIVIPDTELDYGMIVNVYQMLRNGIDRRVTLLRILRNSDIRGEQIGLQGHGYGAGGTYAGLTAPALANLLKTAGVNESNLVIDLLSCNSGKGGAHSYAAALAQELGHSATVYANRGLGVTMDTGYVYSKRDRTPTEQLEYEQIFKDCQAEVEAAKKLASEAQAEFRKDTITEIEVKELFLQYGAQILTVAGTLFGKLYAHQAKLLAAHDDPQSGLYISPKQ